MDKRQRAAQALNSIIACAMTAHALDKHNRKRTQQTPAVRKISQPAESARPARAR
jgi:hypothetical protein